MKMKKKVLFLINTLRDGGAEKVLVDIVNHLDPSVYDIEVRLIYEWGIYMDKLNKNIKLSFITGKPGTLWATQVARMLPRLPSEVLHAFFIKDRYDVEIAFLEGYATKIIAGAPKETKTLAWVHCDVTKTEWISGVYKTDNGFAKCYRKIDHVICVSQSVKGAFIERFGDTGNLIVKYNPVDDAAIRRKAREEIDLKPSADKVTLISLGRFTYPKNFLRLLKAVGNLCKNYPIELWLLGDGQERGALERYIADHNLSDVVKMPGFISNHYPYIKNADLYVCSSIYEGFSTAATEALVLGTPVLTTDVSGMREMLGDNEFGLITENFDKAFESGLNLLLCDEQLLRLYGMRAKQRAAHFEMWNRLSDIEKLF